MKQDNTSTLKNIFSYLWKKNTTKLRLVFILSVIFLLFSRLSNAVAPLIFKMILDKISNPTVALIAVPVGLVIIYASFRVISQVFNELKEAMFVLIEQNAVKKLALEIFTHLHNLSLSFHLNRKTGEITKSMDRGVKAIETILRFSTFNIIPTFFEICLVCIILLIFYPSSYAITILITLTLYSWYTISITEWRTKYIRIMKNTDNKVGYRAIDSILNYETVKYFNNEQLEADNYSDLLENYRKLAIKNRLSLAIVNIGQGFIIAFGLVAINALAINYIIAGSATVGDFALVNAYLLQLYLPLANLGFSYREIKLAYIDIQNLFSLLEEKDEVIDKLDAPELTVKNGYVEFINVSFQYNKERKIIDGISFKIPAGKTCAIVGKSGAGKSTVARLLFRFYDATSGVIKIDGQNVADIQKSSVHKCIGVVPQDTVLFNDTIFYNIAYGAPGASMEEVIKVSELADIHKFIETLPEKYNTLVGERGLKLSGGEKQRVAIARLLLKNPKIFIFDEATSSLDTKTEKSIQKSIKQVSRGHTTLIIAHRLSTVADADEIIVLDNGKIAERGTHQDLLDLQGIYHDMWQQQNN